MRTTHLLAAGVAASAILLSSTAFAQDPVKLVIESWRQDDLATWQDKILPAFEATHPGIDVEFRPTINTEYSTALATKIQAGTAGDLIMIEPFDFRLQMYLDGNLAKLNDLPGMENFSDTAKSAWRTDDGQDVFGVPLAAVIHGFIYNADIFKELGLTVPKTEAEFLDVLKKIKDDGRYTALDMGTADSFVPGLLGFQLIGPSYWHGEEGRQAVIDGSLKFTDPKFVRLWSDLKDWIPYLPDGYQGVKYGDMQNLFTLGTAAIYPAGSWEIPIFNGAVNGSFAMDAFVPPVPDAGDECYVNDHMDAGMGLNPKSAHPEEARQFLTWLTSAEFAQIWGDSMPGFFPLSNHPVQTADPLAKTFLSWREACKSTPRISYQIISRGEPNLDAEISRVTALVVNGELEPEAAAQEVQAGLESWYAPQQKK